MKTILCLEFASERRSAAVARDGVVLAESHILAGRATSAPNLIQEALRSAGLSPADVNHLAIGIGPGSYTGIRRSIATMQGWHLARGTPISPVNSFLTLAALAAQHTPAPVILATDAQRGEWAVVETHQGELASDLRLVPRAELDVWIAAGRPVVSPDAHLTGATRILPTAAQAALLAFGMPIVPPEELTAVYLREASFVKAPPARILPAEPC
jgi:tRNA threonylcarbamoyl adenosine modification protein YeaZ